MGGTIASFFGLSGSIGTSTPGQLIKSEGGLGGFLFGVPKPLKKAIRVKRVAGNVSNLSSAITTKNKIFGAMALQSSLKGFFPGSRKMMKRNNIPLPGQGRKGIYGNNKKNSEEKTEAQIAKNILTGKFAQNIRNQQGPKLPPIKVEGEFAPFFGQIMTKFRIEGVTRLNFINKFIEGITSETKNDDINKIEFARDTLIEFRKKFDAMIIPKVRDCRNRISAVEEEIKSFKLIYNKINQNENNKEEIKKLENSKKKLEEEFQTYTNFLNKKSNNPKDEQEIKKFFKIGEAKNFQLNLFFTKNYWDFHTRITDKIKELGKKIDEYRENSITANERYIRKIESIITSHTNFFDILSFLFNHIIQNKNDDEKEADIKKLIEMTAIIDNILQQNKNGYEMMITLYGSKKNRYVNKSKNFQNRIAGFYQKNNTAKIAMKQDINSFLGTKKVMIMYSDASEKIKKQNLDIKGLQDALNKLIQELYSKYNLENPEIMQNMVPPITLHKSLNYKKLIDIIFNLVFNKKKFTPDEYIKILKLKLYIDEFMNRLGGSNYEKYKLEYDSRIIDKKFKKIISNFDSEVTKLNTEISGKSVEQLKTETNQLLDELKTNIERFSNSNKIGNIQEANSNSKKLSNAANLESSANQDTKILNNAASVASTRNENKK